MQRRLSNVSNESILFILAPINFTKLSQQVTCFDFIVNPVCSPFVESSVDGICKNRCSRCGGQRQRFGIPFFKNTLNKKINKWLVFNVIDIFYNLIIKNEYHPILGSIIIKKNIKR